MLNTSSETGIAVSAIDRDYSANSRSLGIN
jgi:hypothetical protein